MFALYAAQVRRASFAARMLHQPKSQDYGLLLLLTSQWSMAFLFVKLAAGGFSPLAIAAGRVIIAGAALAVIAVLRGERLPHTRSQWGRALLTGAIGSVAPFALIGWGSRYIESALIAVLVSVMPLATLFAAHFLTRDEKLSLRKFFGMAIGFSGVVWLVGPGVLGGVGNALLAQLAVVVAAVCWAVSNIIARGLGGLSPASSSAGIMIGGTLIAVPLCLIFDPPWALSPDGAAIFGLAGLALWSTGAGMLVFMRLVTRVGATFVAWSNYLNPVLGVVWGWLFLDERLPAAALGALALILAGIAAANLRLRRLV